MLLVRCYARNSLLDRPVDEFTRRCILYCVHLKSITAEICCDCFDIDKIDKIKIVAQWHSRHSGYADVLSRFHLIDVSMSIRSSRVDLQSLPWIKNTDTFMGFDREF